MHLPRAGQQQRVGQVGIIGVLRRYSYYFSRLRFYYYQGRIKATQLDYSEAHKYLVQSSRKAPQNSANGFKQHVTKLSITVELLLGNIPERQAFLAKDVSLSSICFKTNES